MSREKSLFSNTIILSVGTVLPKIATFLILPILTAYLTKFEYGSYDLIITSLSFFLPIITLQIEQASFRFLIDKEKIEEKSRVISTSTVYVLLASVLMYFSGLIILSGFSSRSKQLILIFAIANLFYRYLLQVNRGLRQLKIYSAMSLSNSLLNVIFVIIFVWQMELGLEGLLLSLNISIVLSIIFGFLIGRLGQYLWISSFDKNQLKELLAYSIPLLPNAISWWVVGLSDRWIITSFLGLQFNAIYAIANKIPSIFNLLYNNFALAWQESASRSLEDEDYDKYYSSVFDGLYNFMLGAILLLITVSPAIFKLLVDKSYASAYYQMPILFIAVFFHSLASFYGGIYIAFKQSKQIGKSAFLAAALNVLINLIFVKSLGLYAASLSTLISYLAILIYRVLDVRSFVEIKYGHSKILFGLVFVIIVSGVNYLNNTYLNIINFIFALIIALIYNKNLLKEMFERIRLKKGLR